MKLVLGDHQIFNSNWSYMAGSWPRQVKKVTLYRKVVNENLSRVAEVRSSKWSFKTRFAVQVGPG